MSKELFTGLPDELQDLLDDTSKSSSKIEIKLERRKYGKLWAIVKGADLDGDALKNLMKNIKNKMATAGTIKGNTIEVLLAKRNNDRTDDLIDILVENGFSRDSIHVVKK
ncbi:MAG: stress response translation initiation inhibitor YciH [Nanoarchaeota archaeon]